MPLAAWTVSAATRVQRSGSPGHRREWRSFVGSLENFPVRLTGPCAVVTLPAEIDIGNAGQITDTLLAVLNRGVTTLVADMTATTFCACAGASALARAHQRAAANQAQADADLAQVKAKAYSLGEPASSSDGSPNTAILAFAGL